MEKEQEVGLKFSSSVSVGITPQWYTSAEGGKWQEWPIEYGSVSISELHNRRSKVGIFVSVSGRLAPKLIFAICVGDYRSRYNKLVWDSIVGFRNECQ